MRIGELPASERMHELQDHAQRAEMGWSIETEF